MGRNGYIDAAMWLYHSWLGALLCVITTHCHGRPFSTDVKRCGWNARFCVRSQRCACNAITSTLPNASRGGAGMPTVGLLRNTWPDLAARWAKTCVADRVTSVAFTQGGIGVLAGLGFVDNGIGSAAGAAFFWGPAFCKSPVRSTISPLPFDMLARGARRKTRWIAQARGYGP